ncbi:MAG TPA: tRNA epoxyqueuosine(34) reductase QueG [Polyangiaceae bacterium]|nr:tRNA epoxyqueuosine(34) reductase QueG [Polyangiaceae bacterium]
MNDVSGARDRAGVERHEPCGEPPHDVVQTPAGLSRAIEREALKLGFAKVGFTSVEPLERDRAHLRTFREAGHAADMVYLQSGDRHDPRALLAEARSAVVVALAHDASSLVQLRSSSGALLGNVARYARGDDYHMILKRQLSRLAARIATLVGRTVVARACVDTAPLLERALAARAGIGFAGKSTLLIAPGLGSFVLLGELLLDVELEPSSGSASGCGSCRACLDACPTQAFRGPHSLDARRCIAYLTIEYDGVIARELRRPIGNRVFGCDVCQDVCPFNASPRPRHVPEELTPRADLQRPDLLRLLNLGAADYRRLVRRTALRRASRTTLQRNAALALGNSGDPQALPALLEAVQRHARPVVRLHAVWAVGQLASPADPVVTTVLEQVSQSDSDGGVRDEAAFVLQKLRAAALAVAATAERQA